MESAFRNARVIGTKALQPLALLCQAPDQRLQLPGIHVQGLLLSQGNGPFLRVALKRNNPSPSDDTKTDAAIARLVGKRKRVLDVTSSRSHLDDALARHECTIVELRDADFDGASPSKLLAHQAPFDVVVLRDALRYIPQPTHVLAELVAALGPGGYVVAIVPNALHGAIVLALLSGDISVASLGVSDDAYLPFLTADTVGDLFLAAGLHLQQIERVQHGIFERSPLLPRLVRGEFDRRLIAEIESAPESDTLQLVIKAQPLNATDAHRAIVRRFEEGNKQSVASRRSMTSRMGELSRLRSTVAAMRSILEQYPLPATSENGSSSNRTDELREVLSKAVTQAASLRSNEAVSSELESAVVRNEHLSQRAEEAERRLDDLLRNLIVSTQSESARLALLIDTVQSSHFWRLKRWLGRLLHRGA